MFKSHACARFNQMQVSRRHALVYRDEEGARILDDRSLNGVFRNGDRVELAPLADGDEIAIGKYRLYFIACAASGAGWAERYSSASAG